MDPALQTVAGAPLPDQFRLIFEHAPVGMMLVDADGTVLHANATVSQIFGYAADELVGRPVETLVPPAQRDEHLRRRAHYHQAPVPRRMDATRDLVGRRRDGTDVPVEVGLSPLRLGDRPVVVAFVTDITERRHAAEASARLAAIVSTSDDAIVGKTPDGLVTSWNAAAERLFGYTAEEMLGQPIACIIPPERLEEEATVLARIGRGERVPHFESLRRRRDGTLLDVALTISGIRDPGGRLIGLSTCARDVTERKRVAAHLARINAELEETAVRFTQIANSLPQLVWTCTADGACDYLNEKWAEYTGLPAERQLGGAWLDQVHADDRDPLMRMWRHSVGTGTEFRCEFRIRRHDGEYRWFDTRAIPLRDLDGRIQKWFGSNTDITSRKEDEARRAQMERKLVAGAKFESLGVLAAGIAHDFNNLLTSVLGHASLTRMELPASAPIQTNLAEIEDAARRAAELCRQMLACSGQAGLSAEPVELNALLRDLRPLLEPTVGRGVTFALRLPTTTVAIKGDRNQLEQAVTNLVLNAAEAVAPGPGTVSVALGVRRIDVAAAPPIHGGGELPPGNYACLEVADTGCGMTPETLERVFDPFFTTKFTGRGLGLSAVLGIARAHRGGIEVSSESGRGARFRMYFPLAEAPAGPARRAAPPEFRPPAARRRVLVVDDEPSVREVVARVAERSGYLPAAAATGHEAIAEFRSEPGAFALVLLDLTMPEMDGARVCRELHRLDPAVPVVLMSGYSHEEALTQLGDHEIAGFLKKPFELETLGNALRAAART